MTTGRQENSDEEPPASVGQWGIAEIDAAKHCGRGNIPGGYKGHTWRQIGRAPSPLGGLRGLWPSPRLESAGNARDRVSHAVAYAAGTGFRLNVLYHVP